MHHSLADFQANSLVRRLILSIVLLAMSAASAAAAIINFAPLAQPGASFNNLGGVYVQDGFQFTSSLSMLAAWQNSSANHPVGGVPATSLTEFFATGLTTMTQVGGAPFDLLGIDLAGYSTAGSGPFNVTFTGTKSDSSTVQQTFTPVNASGFQPVLQPFTFNSNFTDLVSVSFTQGFNGSNAYQFNNLVVNSSSSQGSAQFLGPSPYISFADSPFNGIGLPNFYFEDFEDGVLDTQGVSASIVGGAMGIVPAGGIFTDSVDADSGTINGNGNAGRSLGVGFFDGNPVPTTVTFSFDEVSLGRFPTHAGIAWTDVGESTSPQGYGYGQVTLEAFDPQGNSLGTRGPYLLGDGDTKGQTAEDRFFGVVDPGGISKITLSMNSDDWEMDHLQYGFVPRATSWHAGPDLAANESPNSAAELSNPNFKVPEWSYGHREQVASTALTLFSAAAGEHTNTGPPNLNLPLQGWSTPNYYLTIPFVVVGVEEPLSSEYLVLHPQDEAGPRTYVVVRWTAPQDGSFHISADWQDFDDGGGDGVDVHLIKNGTTSLFDAIISNGGSAVFPSGWFALSAGDTLDFVVGPGPNGDFLFDTTGLRATIIPEPSGLACAFSLLLVIGQSLRPRRAKEAR
jgi:hypothetical protein